MRQAGTATPRLSSPRIGKRRTRTSSGTPSLQRCCWVGPSVPSSRMPRTPWWTRKPGSTGSSRAGRSTVWRCSCSPRGSPARAWCRTNAAHGPQPVPRSPRGSWAPSSMQPEAAPSRTSTPSPWRMPCWSRSPERPGLLSAILVRSRVKPFQPTILLDGLIVSLAAGAVAAVLMDAAFLDGLEASTAVIALKVAYPLGAVDPAGLRALGAGDHRLAPNRTWTAAVVRAGVGRGVLDGLPGATPCPATMRPARSSTRCGSPAGLLLAYAAWQPHETSHAGAARWPTPPGRHVSGRGRSRSRVLVLGQFLSVGFAAVVLAAAALVALISRAAVSFKESVADVRRTRASRRRRTPSRRSATAAS